MQYLRSKTSTPSPGATFADDSTRFCFYCPKAVSVECVIFDRFDDPDGTHHPMEKDEAGYWHLSIPEVLKEKWYGYRAVFDEGSAHSPYQNEIFADPYSRHVTVKNNYRQEARSYLFGDHYDWENDRHCFPEDLRDLIIYETHIHDLVGHPSAKAAGKGTYQKFTDPNQQGGIAHLKKLGVNCVEFLPLPKFPPQEPPFCKKTAEGFHNTWNPYSTNYWGYMTSFFLAPETSYASDHNQDFSGKTTAAVHEFKDVVKSLHREGITVIMDVVYNHTSLFDLNPLTHLSPETYLRYDEDGKRMNRSGTGNEFRSENPVARRLIIDSLFYWIEEYHVDGFRFDLAALLDLKTWKEIRKQVHKKYPDALLIAEPWGGHYAPRHFSEHGWAAWNDRIRNSLKGSDPTHDRGFIFGEWQHETRRGRLENLFLGTLEDREGGLFFSSEHSINYLESHDGYTLGDFIRIGLNPDLRDQKISDRTAHAALNEEQMKISKLAALALFTAQGVPMIHAGQEFARSKIIAETSADDPAQGKMDHNSYQKNNETNWLNFDDVKLNRDLLEYYRGLIQIRLHSPALCKSRADSIHFLHHENPLLVCFHIDGKSSSDLYDYLVILNATPHTQTVHNLPAGSWEKLADQNIASIQTIDILRESAEIAPRCGILLRKLRH